MFLTISTARISVLCFTGYNLSRRIDRQGLIATFYIDRVKEPNLVEPNDVAEVPADQNASPCPSPHARRLHSRVKADLVRKTSAHRQRRFNSVGDESKCRSTFHVDWWTTVLRKNEYIRMIGWVFTPPAFPILIWPWPSNMAKHISA